MAERRLRCAGPVARAGLCVLVSCACAGGRAWGNLITNPAAVGPNPSLITFETGSTALPTVPGVTFPDTSTQGSGPNFGGVAAFNFFTTFFGAQSYGNLSTFRGYT